MAINFDQKHILSPYFKSPVPILLEDSKNPVLFQSSNDVFTYLKIISVNPSEKVDFSRVQSDAKSHVYLKEIFTRMMKNLPAGSKGSSWILQKREQSEIAKFAFQKDARDELLGTGIEELVFMPDKYIDSYWGGSDENKRTIPLGSSPSLPSPGKNYLGKILEKIRKNFKHLTPKNEVDDIFADIEDIVGNSAIKSSNHNISLVFEE